MISNHSVFHRLNSSGRKGDNGIVLIIGGSERYTGAPIFTALGSFRSGCDIVYILTSSSAVNTIKALHEAIVLPIQFDLFILNKITSCVIGPGLGIIGDKEADKIKQIVEYLNHREIPFVIDADAIHLYKNGVFNNLKICILTPNYKEAKELTVQKHHCCIYKGKVDLIIYKDSTYEISTPSSFKRCGGQGDILSGILATALSIEKHNILDVCISASNLLRKSSYNAFIKKGFSLITSDIFEFITDSLLAETGSKI